MRSIPAVLLGLLAAGCGSEPGQSAEVSHQPFSTPTRAAALAALPPAGRSISKAVRQNDSLDASRVSAIAVAASRVAPAVTSVNVTRRERAIPRSAWDQFFMPRGSERLVQGLGSGFVISPDGIVITNQHVTAGADQIVVTTIDGTDYDATLLGEDPLTDIAVLKIDGHDLPTVQLGRSRDLIIGEWVIAIGNPYGYLLGNTEPTVTAGVVSAVDRNLVPSGDNSGIYVGMIQTDAAINPGNSGGPLANARGEVIGVNSSILSSSGGSVGIGFAIPIERALRVATELQQLGHVRRAWLGLDVIGGERLRNWKRAGGLEVTRVAPSGPAASAGIRAGDVLVSAGGKRMRTFLDLEAIKLDLGPNDSVNVLFRHRSSERRATLRVEELPTTRAEKVSTLGDMQLVTLTPAIRQERGYQRKNGVMIYSIGDAAKRSTGLKAGDLIFQINRQLISEAAEVTAWFKRARRSRAPIRVYIERGGAWYSTDFYVR
ncbi:MAG: trypsin-like peptidase domain-containing protein [Gemmatimonadales bacterium]